MDLNDLERFQQLDKEKMIDHINNLPQQLTSAWQFAYKCPLPDWQGIETILVAGMGGSAIGGDLVAAYAAPSCDAAIIVHRDYQLPAWAHTEKVLVVCSSHSGNTEETLDVFMHALKSDCRILVITTGGEMAALAEKKKIPLWRFDYPSQPRAAIGYSFALLLALLARLKLIPDPESELRQAISAMQDQAASIKPEVVVVNNPAKRLAGQLVERCVTIFGAGIMGPVARRWKCQINENAKSQATFELLPEADHNTLQGIKEPDEQFGAAMNVFLRAPVNHPRNQLRDEFTRKFFMIQGQNTDFYLAQGQSRLAQMLTTLHFGDYVSYYLAMANGVDPTPVPMLSHLKEKMKAAG